MHSCNRLKFARALLIDVTDDLRKIVISDWCVQLTAEKSQKCEFGLTDGLGHNRMPSEVKLPSNRHLVDEKWSIRLVLAS